MKLNWIKRWVVIPLNSRFESDHSTFSKSLHICPETNRAWLGLTGRRIRGGNWFRLLTANPVPPGRACTDALKTLCNLISGDFNQMVANMEVTDYEGYNPEPKREVALA